MKILSITYLEQKIENGGGDACTGGGTRTRRSEAVNRAESLALSGERDRAELLKRRSVAQAGFTSVECDDDDDQRG